MRVPPSGAAQKRDLPRKTAKRNADPLDFFIVKDSPQKTWHLNPPGGKREKGDKKSIWEKGQPSHHR